MRHEEVAAFAAGAEAHLTGELAVCAGSCGPGNLHLINGLFDCHRSRVPVLAIAAQIPSAEIGTRLFPGDPSGKRSSTSAAIIASSSRAPTRCRASSRSRSAQAVGKRGVSVVVIPGDVALQSAATRRCRSRGHAAARSVVAPAAPISIALRRCSTATSRVTILCGSGCQGAHDELVALGDRLKAPIVHAFRGKEHVEWDNPYDVGMTGLIGFSSGYYAMRDCDVLLMLGTDFPYRQFYPRGAGVRIAQVDLRAENIGRRAPSISASSATFARRLQALLPLIEEKRDGTPSRPSAAHYAKARKALDELAAGTPGKRPIHPQQVAKAISDHAADDAVFTCDVGLPTVWAARYLAMNGKRRLIGSFWHGSMANAMAQAIGAQAAFPGRQVISLSGDGGFTMLMGDFLSLAQHAPAGEGRGVQQRRARLHRARAEVLRLSRFWYGASRTRTSRPWPRPSASAASGSKILLRSTTGLPPHSPMTGPVLIDAVVNRTELAMPPSITLEMAKGFTLYMVKAVISGRGDEIIDLAKTNLWR